MIDFWYIITIIIVGFCVIEGITVLLTKFVNKKFQWLILQKDEFPNLSQEGLMKFFSHGYDSELGWVRKPNTQHSEKGKDGITNWSVNSEGSRNNPECEHLPKKISCYGDSFTFARQVNDFETWEHYLSKLSNTNVQNWGVGNYGLDQALLRLKREFTENETEIVIMGVVPDTISRIVSVWKHYYEYGNTFGFKPRFYLKNKQLSLFNNEINNEKKFYEYRKHLQNIQEFDYFYKRKFKKEILRFPYSLSIIKNPKRNFSIIFWVIIDSILKKIGKNNLHIEWKPMQIIMNTNLKWRIKLFNDKKITSLLKNILEEYVEFSKKSNFKAVFVFLPQKDDVLFIKSKYHFYQNLLDDITSINGLYCIDILNELLDEIDLDSLYSDDNPYGGHYSKKGNKKVAEIIFHKLKKLNLES